MLGLVQQSCFTEQRPRVSNGLAPGHTGRHNSNSGLALSPRPRSLCTCSHSLSPLRSLLTTSSCHSGTFVLLFPHGNGTKPIPTSELWLLPFPLSGIFLCQVLLRLQVFTHISPHQRETPDPPPSLSPIIPFLYLCITFTP